MGRFLRNTTLLFGLWLLLSGWAEPVFLILGLLASAAIAGLQTRHPGPPNPTIPIKRFMFYIPWLLGRIFASNLRTMALILHPRLPIHPKLVRYRPGILSPAAMALLAISITLTPGTVTVEMSGDELVVHILDDAFGEDLTNRRFEEKVRWVFAEKGKP